MPQISRRRRAARVRPYLPPLAPPVEVPAIPASATPASGAPPADPERRPALLARVLDGLRRLPEPAPAPTPPRPDDRTPLVRFIDAERARTVADRTPTEKIPVVAEKASWR